jgi:hypothetical protein
MKLSGLLSLMLLLAGCGGPAGGHPAFSTSAQGSSIRAGNWSITASDSQGNSLIFGALLIQNGQSVTANNFFVQTNHLLSSCLTSNATLSNALVVNTNQFNGSITAEFGTLQFTSALSSNGSSFTGTYSGLGTTNCVGLGASGTITGQAVPSTTGQWTGAIQQCNLNSQSGSCAPFGLSSPFSTVLAQNDSTGNVTGTYVVTSLNGLSSGSVSVVQSDQDRLSGFAFQFSMTDISGTHLIASGTLGLDRTFTGVVRVVNGNATYLLNMSH